MTTKVRFTEFEARCKRCRFFRHEPTHIGGVPMYECIVALPGKPTVRPLLYDAWEYRKYDWCPDFDEPPPKPPGLFRRFLKGLGLC